MLEPLWGEDARVWPSIGEDRLLEDGQDTIVKGLRRHGNESPLSLPLSIIVVELGLRGFCLLYPEPGFSGWGDMNSSYCPIVPLWPTYMGLVRVGRRGGGLVWSRKTEIWEKLIVTAAVTKVSLHFDSSDEATNLNRVGTMFGEYNVLRITN